MNFLINAPALANEYMFSYSIDGDPNFEGTFSQFLAQECTDNNFDIPEGKTYQFTFNECEDIIRWRIENDEFECNPISISIEGDKANINNGEFVDISDVPVNLTILFGDSSINLNPIISPSDYGGDDVLYIFESVNLDELENAGEPTYQYLIKEGFSIIPINGENYYKFVVSSGENLEYYSFDGSDINIYKNSFYLKIESIAGNKISVRVGTSIDDIANNSPTDIAYETNLINLNICFTGESGQNTTPEPPATPEPSTTPEPTYTITVRANNAEYGSVTMAPEGGNYTAGTSVTLTATAKSGASFSYWDDDHNNTDTTRIITVSGDATYTAIFVKTIQYNIDVSANPPEAATVTVDNPKVNAGGTAIVTSTKRSNEWNFSRWMINGVEYATGSETIQLQDINEDKTVVAVYTQGAPLVSAGYITFVGSPERGVVTFSDGNRQYTEAERYSFTEPTTLIVTATVAEGYTFKNWSGITPEMSTNGNQITVTIESGNDFVVTAVYETAKYQIKASVNPVGKAMVVATPDKEAYQYNENVELEVKGFETGYRFIEWSDGERDNPRTIRATRDLTLTANLSNEYTVGVAANPGNAGTVTINGNGTTYTGAYETSVQIAATANQGYRFDSWSDGGAARHNITITENTTLTATFVQTYEVTTKANAGEGSATGAGFYAVGDTVTLVATPEPEYYFVEWTKNGETVCTTSTHQFTMTVATAGEYTAVFAPGAKTITVSVIEGNGDVLLLSGISMLGEHQYAHDVELTFTATPNPGYHFVEWDGIGGEETITMIVDELPPSFGVRFERTLYTITVENSDPTYGTAGIVVGGESNELEPTATFNYGGTCTIQAKPEKGYKFVRWDDENTDNPRTFEVTDSMTYIPIFTDAIKRIINVGVEGNGNVTGAGEYYEGETATLVAVPDSGYHFVHWKDDETAPATRNILVTEDLEDGIEFTAVFEEDLPDTVTISLSTYPNASGTVDGGGVKPYNSSVTVTATANPGYTFVNWKEGASVVSENANYTFNATTNRTLVANFLLNTYTINVTADGGGTVSGGGSYTHGQTATVTATANTGYRFVNWTENGNQVSENASYTFTVTGGRTLVAHFEELPPDMYEITVTTNNSSYGTVSGSGTYAAGSTHEISATPNEHYQFTKWSDNNTDNPRSITVNGVASYQAIFSPKKYEITVNSNGNGTVTGSGTYEYGSTQSISATANAHYHFTGWTDGNNNNPRTITVGGATTYKATFEIDTYTITTNVSPSNAGTISPRNPSVPYGGSVTLDATENDGNTFINWDNDSTKTNPSLTITNVTSAQTHIAYFDVPTRYTVTITTVPAKTGKITGADSYPENSTVTVNADGADGYVFKEWQDERGNVLETSNEYSFTITDNTRLIAVFIEINLTINISSNCTKYTFDFDGTEYTDIDDFNDNPPTLIVGNEYPISISVDEINFNGWGLNGNTFKGGEHILLMVDGTTADNMAVTLTNADDDSGKIDVELDLSNGHLVLDVITLIQHRVSIAGDPAAGGTVAIGSVNGPSEGDYNEGDTITLYATPATGYYVTEWTINDEPIDNSENLESYVLEVEDDTNIDVAFALNRYEITLATNNAAYGSIGSNKVINGNKIYLEHGDTAILTPVANTGYHFTKWADNNSTTAQRTITATSNATYTAIFDANEYQVTVTPNDATMGTVSGSGTYAFGTNATLTATANPGYHFESWSNGQTTPSISIQVSGNVNITAAFAVTPPDEYSIEVLSSNAAFGTTTGSGTYTDGTEVTLTATPAEHCEFTGWTDGVNTATRTVTINSSTPSTFTANFIQTTYTVTLTGGAHGSVNPASISGVYGTKASVTATGDEHYHFTKWNDNDTNATREFTITGNGSYTASFAINRHTINAIADPVSSATVTGSGTYDYGETVMLVADPNPGWELSSWSNGDTELVTSVEVGDENATYTATFTKINYTVAASVSPAGAGSVTGTGTFTYDRQATLRANANQHYRFVRWSDNATANPYIITVQDNVNLTAIFEDILYVITVESDDNTMGTVTGGGNTFIAGTTTTITATPAEHYHFLHWSDGDENETKEIVINGDATYTAYFEIDSHEITVKSANDTLGTVTGSGTYNYGQTAQITATANEHYHFTQWNDGNVENPRTITVTANATYTASFEIDTHEITTGCNDDTMGTVTGAGTYDYGTPIQLEAVPTEHYHFVAWNTGSTDNPLDVTVTEDETYIATFAIDQHSVSCDVDGNGSVSGTGLHDWGASATLTAIPAAHHHFVEWNDGSTNTTYTFTVEDDTVCSALFEIDTHEVTLETNNDEFGSVDGAGTYNWGSETEISATPIEHYHFVEWNDGNTDNPRQILVEGDVTYRATFEIDKHSVTITHTGEGSAVGADTYNYGSPITIGAIPSAHWHFVEWTDGIDTATRDIVVDEDKTYEITFEIDTHTIETNIEGEGTVTGGGVYNWGTTQTLVATPAEHWHFLNWSDGVETATRTITIDGDASYTAIFEIDKHVITVNADGPGVIAVRDEGNDGISAQVVADYGSTVVLYAVPDYKCFLINWNDDDNVPVNGTGRIVETINDKVYYDEYALEVLVEGDDSYTAYFDDIPKQVVTTLPPQPNSHAIIYNGADANSILCAELIKYLILEEAAENNTEVEDIDVINYITVTDITTIQNHESATICGVTMGDRITSDIYNWFREYLLFVPNDESQIAAIKKIAININRVENLYDDCFKNMAAYKQVTVPTQEAIDALIPIDRQSFNKKIMAMMDLGEPVMYDYFVNNILSANTEVVNEIIAAGEEEIVEETKRLVQQFNRYGSDIWKVGNNRKAIVMMTGLELPAGFVIEDMFDEYDSLITFNRLNDSDFEVSIYNVMHQLKDWNGRRRLTTDEKILLQKNMFDAGAYMRDHYQGTGTPVSGTAIISEDKFTSLLKAKKL